MEEGGRGAEDIGARAMRTLSKVRRARRRRGGPNSLSDARVQTEAVAFSSFNCSRRKARARTAGNNAS